MTNEEKAKELYHKYRELNLASESAAFNAALEMAEWMKEQMIEKFINWFESTFVMDYNAAERTAIIKDFKQAMKEE